MCDLFQQPMQSMCKPPMSPMQEGLKQSMPVPPMPGQGMNITISIDLGSFMNPCLPPEMQGCMPAPMCPPSTSLTKMPKPSEPEYDECKVISFTDEKEKAPKHKPEGDDEEEC